MDIASRIRRARIAAGISQRGLATLLAVSNSAIAQWEMGRTTPTVANRVDLARALRVPFYELVPEGDPLMPSEPPNEAIRKLMQQAVLLGPKDQLALLALALALRERAQSNPPPIHTGRPPKHRAAPHHA